MTTKHSATTRSPNRGGAYFLRSGFGCSEAVGGGEEESLAGSGETAMGARQESVPKYFQVSETSKVLMKVGEKPSILRSSGSLERFRGRTSRGFRAYRGRRYFDLRFCRFDCTLKGLSVLRNLRMGGRGVADSA